MKKSIIIGALGLLAVLSLSCSKDPDASVLYGDWRWKPTGEVLIEVETNNPQARLLIEADVKAWLFETGLTFQPEESEFGEYHYDENGTQISYISGTYFYNHGFKARYLIADGIFGHGHLDLDLLSPEELRVGFDAVKRYSQSVILEELGVSDPAHTTVSRVWVIRSFTRY